MTAWILCGGQGTKTNGEANAAFLIDSDEGAEVLNGYWAASRIRNVRVPREGHCYHVRSADDFNKHITAFAS